MKDTSSSQPARASLFLAEHSIEKAAAIVSDEVLPGNIPCLVVTENVRLLLARMAAKFYGFPSRELNVTGVTGTNGKTTITYLIESIVRAIGRQAQASSAPSPTGTHDHLMKAPNTTPESVEIQALLADMREEGVGPRGDGGLVPCPGSGQGRGGGLRLRHLYQPYPRPSRLPWRFRPLQARQRRLLFHRYLQQSAKERKYAIINIDDASAPRFHPRAAGEDAHVQHGGSADAYLTSYS